MMQKMKMKVYRAVYSVKERMNAALRNEDGVGTVEVVLLILVAVGLVLIFKEQITELVESIFEKITSRSGKI